MSDEETKDRVRIINCVFEEAGFRMDEGGTVIFENVHFLPVETVSVRWAVKRWARGKLWKYILGPIDSFKFRFFRDRWIKNCVQNAFKK